MRTEMKRYVALAVGLSVVTSSIGTWSGLAGASPSDGSNPDNQANTGDAPPSEATGSTSSAQKASARQRYEEGVRLYNSGKLTESLAAFEHAYRLAPHHAVLFNIGQLQSELGQPVAAVKSLRRYLEQGAGRIAAVRLAEALRVLALNEQRVGFLAVEAQPKQAAILVDGNQWLSSTVAQPVAQGRHVVVATHDGYLPKVAAVQIASGATESLSMSLEHDSASQRTASWVTLTCPVPDAVVYIDDREPIRLKLKDNSISVATGTRHLRFERAGYATKTFDTVVTPERIVAVDCGLEVLREFPEAQRASLAIVTNWPDSRVLVDGKPFRNGLVPTGRHHIRVLHGSNLTWESEIKLVPGQVLSIPVDPPSVLDAEYRKDALEREETRRLFAYITGGAGMVLMAAGVATIAVGRNRHAEWDKENYQADNWSKAANSAVAIQRIEDLGVGMAIGGVACLAASVYLWLTGKAPIAANRGAIGTNAGSAAWLWHY